MKRTLGCLRNIDKRGEVFEFAFDYGSLSVSFVSRDVVLFDYNVLGYEVPSFLKAARDYICSRSDSTIDVSLKELEDEVVLASGTAELRIEKANGNISVFRDGKLVHGGMAGGKDTVIPQTQFSMLGNPSEKIGRLVFAREMDDSFYGLGDKGGSPDRTGRRVRMYNKDALGYDAENSDPLYKSIPFLLKVNRSKGTSIGLYFPDPCIRCFDICSESRFYFSAEIVDGPFSYALIMGDDYRQVLSGYCRLSGKPAFPPLYSFGYFGSSMNYAEAWDAQQRIERFFKDVEERDLPCEGLYVSSGYLKADDGKRYSFFWNRRKFPDPKAFLEDLRERGYHLTFNIKPGILKTHPWYSELVDKGYLLKDNDGNPIVEYFWGGDASFIDFNNPDAVKWWKGKLNEAYLDFGVEGVWNDNNECELADGELDAYKVRTLYPVRMAQVSYEACLEKNPNVRPWIYSRSGYAGMQRYARTWTGDNVSDFKTLKYNQYQGASMGLSGVPFVGHDLGGFFGPEPSAELLVRCCQSAIFQARFVIHSWREDDRPTEPWKFKDAYPLIKEALFDHYRHIPYIYNTARQALNGIPMERLLCLEYPSDARLCADIEQSMFGDSVMKAPVVNQGQGSKSVVFPEGDNWYCPMDGKIYKGGTTETFETPLCRTLYFYKAGSVVPRSLVVDKLRTGYFSKLQLFIVPSCGNVCYDYYEDDGFSVEGEHSHNIWHIEVSYDSSGKAGKVSISCRHLGDASSLVGRQFHVTFPDGFSEEVVIPAEKADGAEIPFGGEYR